MLSLNTQHWKRYREVVYLLVKYGWADVASQIGLLKDIPQVEEAIDHGETRADELARDLESLGPTFVKLGQLLSTRTDMLPEPYVEALTRLQDDVEPVPFAEVREVIESEFERPLDDLYAEFEEEPLASASLGQVHRGRLKSGLAVAVKVQRIGVEETVREDLAALHEIAALLDKHTDFGKRYELTRFVDLLSRVLIKEMDYEHEADNLGRIRENLGGFSHLLVPQPISEAVSKRVLTMELIDGRKITELNPAKLVGLPGDELAEELFRAYMQQVLINGLFHADPHPGNLLLTPTNRIALIDLGSTFLVSPQMQEWLFQLLLAISDGRGEDAADVTIKLGVPKKGFEKTEFRRAVTHLVSETQYEGIRRLHTGRVVLNIQQVSAHHGFRLPEEVTMLGKTLMHLDKVLSVLSPEFQLNASMRHYAQTIMRRQALKYTTLPAALQSLLEVGEFAQKLPGRLNKIVDLIAENELKLAVDALDERRLLRGIQKVANRITAGLVLAALIVGASITMHIDSSVTFLGYPVLSVSFFLLAAVGGLFLVFKTVFSDE